MLNVTIDEIKSDLLKYLRLVEEGETVVINCRLRSLKLDLLQVASSYGHSVCVQVSLLFQMILMILCRKIY
ncbi:type II toxin-antitoxin system Phd/YefM family antitoxin [Okeania sp. SIO1I7]|uniref:type II toxin-antitoxin system Phd/YefM family antitoxin n=1 Tax=Okeania sp. SIO1I7 TaxID=2607772 RepID=UPI0025D73B14|nr:hypothetical protein [Okeania sp. SIO1I7]